jgi:hypothetical protein
MTRTKDIEKIAELGLLAIKDDLAEYKGKWANLWFLFSGESFKGNTLYFSQGDAESRAGSWLMEALKTPEKPINDVDKVKVGRSFFVTDISHFIPIPVKP